MRHPAAGTAEARAGRRGRCALAQLGQAVLGGDRDRLEQRADRRRVDVLHPGQVLERGAALGHEREEVAALLDPLAAVELAADQAQRARLGQQLDVGRASRPGSSARATRRPPWRATYGTPIAVGQRLADREAADRVVAGHQPPRHPHRVVGAVLAGGVRAGGAALGVGVRAGQPADRQHRQPVRHLDHVAGGPHARRGVRMWSSTTSPPVYRAAARPRWRARCSAACAGRRSRRRTRARPSTSPPRARARRRRTPSTGSVPMCSVDAELLERLVDGLGDVGVEHLGQHPRPLVDEVHLEAAVAEVAGHLDAEPRRADHHRASSPSSSTLSNSIACGCS